MRGSKEKKKKSKLRESGKETSYISNDHSIEYGFGQDTVKLSAFDDRELRRIDEELEMIENEDESIRSFKKAQETKKRKAEHDKKKSVSAAESEKQGCAFATFLKIIVFLTLAGILFLIVETQLDKAMNSSHAESDGPASVAMGSDEEQQFLDTETNSSQLSSDDKVILLQESCSADKIKSRTAKHVCFDLCKERICCFLQDDSLPEATMKCEIEYSKQLNKDSWCQDFESCNNLLSLLASGNSTDEARI